MRPGSHPTPTAEPRLTWESLFSGAFHTARSPIMASRFWKRSKQTKRELLLEHTKRVPPFGAYSINMARLQQAAAFCGSSSAFRLAGPWSRFLVFPAGFGRHCWGKYWHVANGSMSVYISNGVSFVSRGQLTVPIRLSNSSAFFFRSSGAAYDAGV